jgi:hypothetical protein
MFDSAPALAAVPDASPPGPFRAELAPELLLPSQFHAGVRHDASVRPEKRLMLAVLEGAVADFQRHVDATGSEGRRAFREAEQWFASNDVAWPYSFPNICQALGLELAYVRAGLRRWRDAQRGRVLRGEPVVRIQLRRVAGIRSKATGRAPVGRVRSRW